MGYYVVIVVVAIVGFVFLIIVTFCWLNLPYLVSFSKKPFQDCGIL